MEDEAELNVLAVTLSGMELHAKTSIHPAEIGYMPFKRSFAPYNQAICYFVSCTITYKVTDFSWLFHVANLSKSNFPLDQSFQDLLGSQGKNQKISTTNCNQCFYYGQKKSYDRY